MFTSAERLLNVDYAVRGPLLQEAEKMVAAGSEVIHLNIGNPAPFGFRASDSMVEAVVRALREETPSHGYTSSQGLPIAVEALYNYYRAAGEDIEYNNIFVGNGASELISITLMSCINPGDVVHLPMPDYPLWTAATRYSGGQSVFYPCDEQSSWCPDIKVLRSQITDKSKALVIINPNNPTGAVYPRDYVEQLYNLAAEHKLLVLSDEIYHGIVYDGAHAQSLVPLCTDTVCFRFSGLSKRYCATGFRVGWLTVSGALDKADDLLQSLRKMLSLRLCSGVPAQYAIPAALEDKSMEGYVQPGGRLYEQRNVAWKLLNDIPGVSCVKPQGALYAFPRFDAKSLHVEDDEAFLLQFLRQKKVLLINGRGFHYPDPDHFRMVFLADVKTLTKAISHFADFIQEWNT